MNVNLTEILATLERANEALKRSNTQGRQVGQVLALTAAEFLCIHEMLDKLEVSRMANGQKLSAAQRVAELVGAYKMAVACIGRKPG